MKNEIKVALQPVKTTRASEEIYEQIRQLILNGDIQPGEHLPSERKMMEMMQRSRPTIREAMRVLERDGYIKIQSGSSGAVVQELNVDNAVQTLENVIQFQKLTIKEILEFRLTTECDAASLASKRRTQQDLADMIKVLQQSEETAGNPEEFISCDLQFHQIVARASGNAMYGIMLQVCRNIIGESLTALLCDGTKKQQEERYLRIRLEHEKILLAITEGNGESACRMMTQHLEEATKDVLKMQGRS
ncbi:MAG: FadR family transcriptional regulator [Lachnospiraceae bacterium]|nr:FadR family transcriptional regulator [Lachnospiraceae bacterium]